MTPGSKPRCYLLAQARRASASGCRTLDSLKGLGVLRRALDARVVSHSEAKEALLLALVSSQHLYIEGIPGSAKTMLAETAAEAAGLRLGFFQLHRDTRLAELVGDEVLIREHDPAFPSGEVIRQTHRPGGILTSEVCILDDMNRAPGEALNVLLRILNERQFGEHRVPLRTAIATGNPAGEDRYFNEALDPATLDRFALQVTHKGLLEQGSWDEARGVVDRYEAEPLAGLGEAKQLQLSPADRASAVEALLASSSLLPMVTVTDGTKRVLLNVLRTVIERYQLNENNSMLSDRTFLVNSVKCIQASALLGGRLATVLEDVHVLRFLTTFRVPPPVHAEIRNIVQAAIDAEARTDGPEHGGSAGDAGPPDKAGADGPDGNDPEDRKVAQPKSADDVGGEPAAHEVTQGEQAHAADGSANGGPEPAGPPPASDGSRGGAPHPDQQETREARAAEAACEQDEPLYLMDPRLQDVEVDEMEQMRNAVRSRLSSLSVHGVDCLASALQGQVHHCRFAALGEHSGGSPRRQLRASGLGDLISGHRVVCSGADVARWLDHPSPAFPMALRRERRWDAGQVVIVRDISGSMTGLPQDWSAAVALSVVEMARRYSLPLGYVEFSTDASSPVPFGREYSSLARCVISSEAEGTTNYQAALGTALQLLQVDASSPASGAMARARNRHILFVTDGVPTEGDPRVAAELAAATAAGVKIHTVFLGKEAARVPTVLTELAARTSGMQFRGVVTDDDIELRRHSPYALPTPSTSEGRQRMVAPKGFLSGYGAGRHEIGAHG